MLRRSTNNRRGASFAAAILLLITASVTPALARSGSVQEDSQMVRPGRVVSSHIEISSDNALLKLELDDGKTVDFAIRGGQAWAGDRPLGPAPRGEEFDRSWRELLNQAMETPTDGLASLLTAWAPPSSAPSTRVAFHRELVAALTGAQSGGSAAAALGVQEEGEEISLDSVARLKRRIAELEQRLEDGATTISIQDRRQQRATANIQVSRRGDTWYSPLRHIWRGFAAILGDLVLLAVLVGMGFVVVYFARKPLETIADTARNETLRSGLVGLAATFLMLPGYVLGIIALAISIVGIPLLIAWVPLFWVAVGVALLLGYLAVGHGIGEGLAERRFYGGEWAKRANSYYYVLTGLAALFAPFIAGHAVQMAGPWLGFIQGLLIFLGGVLTWAVFTIGLGAVLLTRAGTRPRPRPASKAANLDMDDLFAEESRV